MAEPFVFKVYTAGDPNSYSIFRSRLRAELHALRIGVRSLNPLSLFFGRRAVVERHVYPGFFGD